MRIRSSLVVTIAAVSALLTGCGGGKSPVRPTDSTSTTGYRNPVLDQDFPDPTVLRVGTTYWAYATQTFFSTGQRINIQAASSPDLVHWTFHGDALPTKPVWAPTVWRFWAPHVIYAAEQNRYLMYYAADSGSSDKSGHMCIGIASSATPDAAFTDIGAPLVCGNDYWHIDPMAFDDSASGKHYLYWGSDHKPIAVQELAADRVHFAAGSAPVTVIDTSGRAPYESLVEGPWVIKRGAYYYMFYSGNDCCSLPPHYAVLVARSTSPTGPFEKHGVALGSDSSAILTQGDFFEGPGHNAIITDAKGDDWIVYHAVDPYHPTLTNGGVRRPMLIDRLKYDANGWPYVDGGHPSHSYLAPPTVTP